MSGTPNGRAVSGRKTGPGAKLRLTWRMRGGSPTRNRYATLRNEPVRLRDGVTLMADIYLTQEVGPRPTILVRTPYGRPVAELDVTYFAARGYNVAVVASRGTSGSGDAFRPMVHETDDGLDIVEWLREQPWYSGEFATWGQSYLGFVQWALAEHDGLEDWKGMAVLIGPHDFDAAIYGRGVFDLLDFYGWSSTMADRDDPPSSVLGAVRAIRARGRAQLEALRSRSLVDSPTKKMSESAPWIHEWIARQDLDDPYWDPYRHTGVLERVDRPVFIGGAWNDLFLKQSLHQWHTLQQRGVDLEVEFTENGHASTAELLFGIRHLEGPLGWFDRLFGAERPVSRGHRVAVGGTTTTMPIESWPPAADRRSWYGTPSRVLAESARLETRTTSSITLSVDDPTPSVGGNYIGSGAGKVDNRSLEAREDVLTYTTDVLPDDLLLTGHALVSVDVEASAPFDMFVRINDVSGKKSTNVCDSIRRFSFGGKHRVEILLDGTVYRFRKGHRLRLVLAGSAFPRFDLNPAVRGRDEKPGHSGRQVALAFHDQSVQIDLPLRNGAAR